MEHCAFCDAKSAVIDFTQGAKVAGLSACPDFVTNGEQTSFAVYEERAQLMESSKASKFVQGYHYGITVPIRIIAKRPLRSHFFVVHTYKRMNNNVVDFRVSNCTRFSWQAKFTKVNAWGIASSFVLGSRQRTRWSGVTPWLIKSANWSIVTGS